MKPLSSYTVWLLFRLFALSLVFALGWMLGSETTRVNHIQSKEACDVCWIKQ